MGLGGLPRQFKIFYEYELYEILSQRTRDLNNSIQLLDRNEILNANEPELISYFIDSFTYEPLKVNFDSISMTESEGYIQRPDFGELINVKGLYYTFHLPVTGELALLKMKPSSCLLWTIEVSFDGSDEISFKVFGKPEDTQRVINEKDKVLRNIESQVNNVNNELARYNQNVEQNVQSIIQNRKNEILKQMETISAIGVPLKKKNQVPTTFSIPQVKRKQKYLKDQNLQQIHLHQNQLFKTVHIRIFFSLYKNLVSKLNAIRQYIKERMKKVCGIILYSFCPHILMVG